MTNDNLDLFGKILEEFGAYYYCIGDMVICCLHGTANRVEKADCVVGYGIQKHELEKSDLVDKAHDIIRQLLDFACEHLKDDPDMLNSITEKVVV